jgi:2-methylcitrate dehydratase PrpD
MQPLAGLLGAWAAALKAEDIPDSVQAAAKRCIIDVVGVSIAGSHTPVASKAKNIALQQYPPGPGTVIGSDHKLSSLGSSYCNAVFSHCLDFDDTCYDGIVHGSAAVWPAVLASGEMAGASGEKVLTAFIAAVEVEYTLGRFFTNHLYMKGWWNTSVLGVIGAAVAAAKVQDFDETLMINTIQNASCFLFGPRALLGTQIKPIAMGSVSSNGIYAAILAREGLSGPDDVFESSRGIIHLFNDGIKNDHALKTLGREYKLLEPGIAFKLYPVCSAAQAAIEALQQIMADNHLDSSQIREIVCEVPRLVNVSLVYPKPADVTQSQFSMQFALGCILAYGRLGVEHLNEGVLDDPKLQTEMRKVSMIETASFTTLEYNRNIHPEAANVKVKTISGITIELFNGAATGMPVKPMPDSQLDGKFISCVRPHLTMERSRELLKRLREIETVRRINDLFILGDNG